MRVVATKASSNAVVVANSFTAPTRRVEGSASLMTSSRLAFACADISVMPVTLPPGRAKLLASPAPTNTPVTPTTTGIVAVASATIRTMAIDP